MGTTDLAIAAVVLGAALALLVRSFRRQGGGCAGCHGGCAARAPSRDTVQLGTPGHRGRCTP
ncbi:MAG: hypothetical protein U0229_10390 [Anaeromyxobacter sp.]